MATDWGPLVQTGVGGLLALAGSVLGVSLQGRQQRRMERDRRRERAAELLAEVQALLTDATPDPLGLFATEEKSKQIFAALEDRWQASCSRRSGGPKGLPLDNLAVVVSGWPWEPAERRHG